MNNMKITLVWAVAAFVAALPVSGFAADNAALDRIDKKTTTATEPTAVGAWFGIARPCPADAATDSPTHVALCQAVCGTCSSIPGALPPEVPMMPTLLADGTVLADDAGEIGRYHTTAHGNWTTSDSKDGLPDWQGLARFKATFFWLGSAFGPNQNGYPGNPVSNELYGTCCFSNSVRPRFVTYFDPADPDRMIGFIQPYFFPFVDQKTGFVTVAPFSPNDAKAGNHIPSPVDPLAEPLPAGCDNSKGCLGTYHFVIRRIKSQ
jgi:hypothetical protein